MGVGPTGTYGSYSGDFNTWERNEVSRGGLTHLGIPPTALPRQRYQQTSLSCRNVDLGTKDPTSELNHIFGHRHFRPGQKDCIEAALQGRDVFCLMPTGGGKSVVYQLPALCCAGVTVVFSPLVSLIQDQVDLMRAVNVNADFLAAGKDQENSAALQQLERMPMPSRDTWQADEEIRNPIKLLYVTPERLKASERLKHVFQSLNAKGLLSRFVIDEAHCTLPRRPPAPVPPPPLPRPPAALPLPRSQSLTLRRHQACASGATTFGRTTCR